METSVLEVKNNGLTVHLMDGSRWSVNSGDSTKTALWYPSQRISIEETNEGFILTNLDTAIPDKVLVSRI